MTNDNRDDTDYVKMAAAAVSGTRPQIGENRKVSM